MPELAAECTLASRVLYWAFRQDPLFSRVLRGAGGPLLFFEAVEELASSGVLACVSVAEGGVKVAAAVVHTGRQRALPPLSAAEAVVRSLGAGGLLEVSGWLSGSARYWAALRKLKGYCHLLLLGSALPGRGYGSLALRAAEALCRLSGAEWVVLDVDASNPAVLFYHRRGYRPLAEAVFSGRRYLVMAKRLRAADKDITAGSPV